MAIFRESSAFVSDKQICGFDSSNDVYDTDCYDIDFFGKSI